MKEMTLEETIAGIVSADDASGEAAWAHWDSLCKPLRGFGRLEEMVVQMARMKGDANPHCDKRAVVIMGADNGVVAEGVSQTGQEVTAQVLENMGDRITSVCVMSRILNAEIFPVNIGAYRDIDHPGVINKVIRKSTGNIAVEPAMTREECVKAIETGINFVKKLCSEGYDLILTGEMGIGNTTTSAACACALFGRSPQEMTGRGAGLSSEGMVRKVSAVTRALDVNKPDPKDPIDILSKVGGLDIAGMAGCFLGAALCRVPVLIDGVISSIAACMAVMLCPAAKDYMMPTHLSAEPAGKCAMEFLGMEPFLNAGMHLGEGTGAAAFLPLIDQALNVYYGLPRFADANVEQYEHLK